MAMMSNNSFHHQQHQLLYLPYQLQPQQQQWLAVQLQWYTSNISTGEEKQRYNISIFTNNSVLHHIPYALLANNQKARIDISITNNSQTPLIVEAGAVVFQDGLPPLVLLGTESDTPSDSITYGEITQGYNPYPVSIGGGAARTATITTKDLVLAREELVKDATIIFKFRIKDQTNNSTIAQFTAKFIAIAVAEDEPLANGGPYLPIADISSISHISIVEGFFAPFVNNVYQALSDLLNRLTMQNILAELSRRFGASIKGFVAVTSRNGRGERLPKLIIFLKEGSPIAPIAVIIAILAALALILGIIFTSGYLIQTLANLNISQAIQSTVTERNKLAETIVNDPNLTAEQKQQMLDAVQRYYDNVTANIDKTITTIRRTESGIGGIGGGGGVIGSLLTALPLLILLATTTPFFSTLMQLDKD